jgi:hypothetical protein
MSANRKIGFGDNYGKSINEDINYPPPPDPTTGSFSFDRTDITFDTMLRTFDEL